MKLIEIIKDRKCKICEGKCDISLMEGLSTQTIPTIGKVDILLSNDFIIIKKTIPELNLTISESKISIDKELYNIDYLLSGAPKIKKFVFIISVRCGLNSDYENHISQSSKYPTPYQTPLGKANNIYYDDLVHKSHFEDSYICSVDPDTNEIKISRAYEIQENNDFLIRRNFGSSPETKIIKKEKSIRLSFIYDKDLKDLEFHKLIETTKLLK